MVAEDFAIEVHGYSSYSVAKSLRQLLKLLALTFYEIKEMHLNCPLQLLKEVFKQKQQQQKNHFFRLSGKKRKMPIRGVRVAKWILNQEAVV